MPFTTLLNVRAAMILRIITTLFLSSILSISPALRVSIGQNDPGRKLHNDKNMAAMEAGTVIPFANSNRTGFLQDGTWFAAMVCDEELQSDQITRPLSLLDQYLLSEVLSFPASRNFIKYIGSAVTWVHRRSILPQPFYSFLVRSIAGSSLLLATYFSDRTHSCL